MGQLAAFCQTGPISIVLNLAAACFEAISIDRHVCEHLAVPFAPATPHYPPSPSTP
jgi:hypothetical protein